VTSSKSIVPPAITLRGCAGLPATARAEPQREGARPQRARPVPRMRSEGTSCRVGLLGAAERVSRAVPYGSAKRDETRASGVRARGS
jgi:hypothetical protein